MKAWSPVTRARPCPRCGHDSWCAVSRDATAIMCMRDTVGFDDRERTNKAGEPYGFHWIDGARRDPSAYIPSSQNGPTGPEVAPPEDRDRVYRALLDALDLSEQHRQHLRHRGLSPDQVAALHLGGYRTLPDDGQREPAIRAAAGALGGVDALAIPGLYRARSGKSLRLAGRAGLLIPVRDSEGRVVALKIRPDDPGAGGKYVWLSGAHMGGSSPGAPAHVARATKGLPLRIVEGVLKADVAAALDPGTAVVGIPSCSASSMARPAMEALQPARVLLAWDADARANVHVARGLERAVVVVRETLPAAEIAVETWESTAKGIDDALAAGLPIVARGDVDNAVAKILAASQPASGASATEPSTPEPREGTRERVRISDREHEVNDQVLAQLTSEPDLYVRGGALARVALDPSPIDARPPRIEDLPRESLRELVTRRVCFLKLSRDKQGEPREERVHPPDWCIGALHRRGAWPGLRVLTGVIDAPVLRRDGTVLSGAGYDAGTGLFFEPRLSLPSIPEHPTPDEGSAAMARLADILEEFPFDVTSIEGDPQASYHLNLGAALSLVFTLVARPMIAGPVPGFLIDAPDAGAGKTLLAKVLALMGTGHLPDAERWHVDEDEWAKVHLGNLLEGRRVVFFDNVTTGGTFGHGGLDGALTQWPLWKGRILGQTGNVSVRNDCVVVATGNNPRVPNDTIRRLVRIRLRPDEERRAETEIAYRHRLPADAVRDVAELLVAAVTALRAWICAGRPSARIVPWGSFEAWAEIVPQVMYWYGYPDIHRTQDGLRAIDDDADALSKLLVGWQLFGGEDGASPTAVLTALRVPALHGQPRPAGLDLIREGLEGVDPKRTLAQHSPMTLGRLLAKFEGKFARGRRFMRSSRRGDATVWLVQASLEVATATAEEQTTMTSGGAHGFVH